MTKSMPDVTPIHRVDVDLEDTSRRWSLCCRCGEVRSVKVRAPRIGVDIELEQASTWSDLAAAQQYQEPYRLDGPWRVSFRSPQRRHVELLVCTVCRATTWHAYLLSGECRDDDEAADAQQADAARAAVSAVIDDFRAMGVDVREWAPEDQGEVCRLTQFLTDGRWLLEVNPAWATASRAARMLGGAFDAMLDPVKVAKYWHTLIDPQEPSRCLYWAA